MNEQNYYFYNNNRCVGQVPANSFQQAAASAKARGIIYHEVSLIYRADPRTPGEVLDDSINALRTSAPKVLPTVRNKLSGLFAKASAALSTNAQPPVLNK